MAVKQVVIAFDQLINTLIGGWADETLSSHAHRKYPRVARIINLIFFDPNHCRNSYLSERNRTQMPPEFRS